MVHLNPPPIPPVQPINVQTNHTFHLILSVMTCGAWLFAWPCVALWNSYQNTACQRTYARQLATYHRAMYLREQAAEPAVPYQGGPSRWVPPYDTDDPMFSRGPTYDQYRRMPGGQTGTTSQSAVPPPPPPRVDAPSPPPPPAVPWQRPAS